MVEQLICNQRVGGSSPSGGTNDFNVLASNYQFPNLFSKHIVSTLTGFLVSHVISTQSGKSVPLSLAYSAAAIHLIKRSVSLLGVLPDGIWGPETEEAFRETLETYIAIGEFLPQGPFWAGQLMNWRKRPAFTGNEFLQSI
jgi:hypothetical protein